MLLIYIEHERVLFMKNNISFDWVGWMKIYHWQRKATKQKLYFHKNNVQWSITFLFLKKRNKLFFFPSYWIALGVIAVESLLNCSFKKRHAKNEQKKCIARLIFSINLKSICEKLFHFHTKSISAYRKIAKSEFYTV